MEEKLKVDRQGRLILPSNLRERLGLRKDGGKVSARLDGSRIILEPVSEDVEGAVEEWRNTVTTLHAEPFTEAAEQSWKWMSLEYARRKLGLH
ncbi:AbrB/MazE/SpoVT family DNA-binding domain-containing protein [Candidatus Bathyarchaeota archaeon]|nr:AbrB/MazE/SpoVT family DNA-binding domain-containing protein [Candidatus Bathyarchaeota archaeon]